MILKRSVGKEFLSAPDFGNRVHGGVERDMLQMGNYPFFARGSWLRVTAVLLRGTGHVAPVGQCDDEFGVKRWIAFCLSL